MGSFDILEMRVKDSTEFGDLDAFRWQTKDLACRQLVYRVVNGKLHQVMYRPQDEPLKFLGEFTGVVEIAHPEVKSDVSYGLCFREGVLMEMRRTFNWCLSAEGKSNYPFCTDMEKLEARYPNNEKDE